MRRDRLCEPSGCDDAIEVRDEEGFLLRRERCSHCDLDKLDSAIAQDPVLHRAFDFDFALSAGIRLTLEEIDVEEFRALKILRMERTNYERELTEKNRKS
jgi:hypothetical protein